MMRSARIISQFALAILLTACAAPAERVAYHGGDGIGGTGVTHDFDADGIGGTGYGGGDEDGIGGTGISLAASGDVGLVGILTSLEPLKVNGHGLLVPENLAITANGKTVDQHFLALGQVVEVRAGLVDGAPTVKALQIFDSYVGAIQAVDIASAQLRIHDRTIAITASTRFSGLNSVAELKAGERIRVSGFALSDGRFLSSLIARAPQDMAASIAGRVERNEQGILSVAGVTVSGSQFRDGEVVFVSGDATDTQLAFNDAVERRNFPFAGEIQSLTVEQFTPVNASARSLLNMVAADALPQSALLDTPAMVNAGSSAIEFGISPDGALQGTGVRAIDLDVPSLIVPEYVPALPEQFLPQLPVPSNVPGTGGNPLPIDLPTTPGNPNIPRGPGASGGGPIVRDGPPVSGDAITPRPPSIQLDGP